MSAAAARITAVPTAVEPVKEILRTSGWWTSASPATDPSPGTTLSTPGGSPAASATSASSSAESGVSVAGLTTAVLPMASAGATFQAVISSGKFHGTTSAHTPSGSRKVMAVPLFATGSVCPWCLSGAPA
jgi:hypothetical protein